LTGKLLRGSRARWPAAYNDHIKSFCLAHRDCLFFCCSQSFNARK
jgi:hypothetical protein